MIKLIKKMAGDIRQKLVLKNLLRQGAEILEVEEGGVIVSLKGDVFVVASGSHDGEPFISTHSPTEWVEKIWSDYEQVFQEHYHREYLPLRVL